jgi:hypothetical protein
VLNSSFLHANHRIACERFRKNCITLHLLCVCYPAAVTQFRGPIYHSTVNSVEVMFEVVNAKSERRVAEVTIFGRVFSLYECLRNVSRDLGPDGIINHNYSYEETENRLNLFQFKVFLFPVSELKKVNLVL